MLKLRGTTRAKVREFLQDLERAKAIHQVTGSTRGVIVHGWAATEGGVRYWLGSRKDIPVRVAQVASTIDYAVRSEV